jgi:DNA-binding GntR family transcriptional regulator
MAARTVAPKAAVQPKAPRARSSTPARALKANEVWPGPKESLTEQAYAQIEEAIVTLQLAPGTIVSELTLSEMTGIGRTPIREAIQRREVERLVCRSAAKSATPQERDVFAQLAAEFKEASKRNDDVSFVRLDREFNELCLIAARNEFAEAAMRLMHGLARRFWYFHYKQAADIPEMARLHGAVAKAIAEGNVDAAGQALDALLDNIEEFTRATLAEV